MQSAIILLLFVAFSAIILPNFIHFVNHDSLHIHPLVHDVPQDLCMPPKPSSELVFLLTL